MKNKQIHMGLAIENRINELGITKSEFGNRIGVAKQNVAHILKKKSIDTDSLLKYSDALNFNFFTLFCEDEINGNKIDSSNNSGVISGNDTNVNLDKDSVIKLVGNSDYTIEKIKILEDKLIDRENQLANEKERASKYWEMIVKLTDKTN
jgi:transcriptional regulator with XRE-family HTH domain